MSQRAGLAFLLAAAVRGLHVPFESEAIVTTLAGGSGLFALDGTGTAAVFIGLHSVAITPSGTTAILTESRAQRNAVRKLDIATGEVTTLVVGAQLDANVPPESAERRRRLADECIVSPAGVSIDPTGMYAYVLNSRNASFFCKVDIATGGTTLIEFSGATGRTSSVNSIAVVSATEALVTDEPFSGTNGAVRVTLADGAAVRELGSAASASIDGVGTTAAFQSPQGISHAVGDAPIVLIADENAHRIRRVDLTTSAVTTLAGSMAGYADGVGTAARFSRPVDVALAVDASYAAVVDAMPAVRIVDLSSGAVTTLAGASGTRAQVDGTGLSARFSSPGSVAITSSGTITLIVDRLGSTVTIVLIALIVAVTSCLLGMCIWKAEPIARWNLRRSSRKANKTFVKTRQSSRGGERSDRDQAVQRRAREVVQAERALEETHDAIDASDGADGMEEGAASMEEGAASMEEGAASATSAAAGAALRPLPFGRLDHTGAHYILTPEEYGVLKAMLSGHRSMPFCDTADAKASIAAHDKGRSLDVSRHSEAGGGGSSLAPPSAVSGTGNVRLMPFTPREGGALAVTPRGENFSISIHDLEAYTAALGGVRALPLMAMAMKQGAAGAAGPVNYELYSPPPAPAAPAPKPRPAGSRALHRESINRPRLGAIVDLVPGKLRKQIEEVGDGEKMPAGATVNVAYEGKLANGDVFDRAESLEFTLGDGKVIDGWDVGIASMTRGERSFLRIHPSLGYGSEGAGPIPPDETLTFEIQLNDWIPPETEQAKVGGIFRSLPKLTFGSLLGFGNSFGQQKTNQKLIDEQPAT